MTKQKKEKILVVIFNFIEAAEKVFASGNKIMNPYCTFELVHAIGFNTDVKGHVTKKKKAAGYMDSICVGISGEKEP